MSGLLVWHVCAVAFWFGVVGAEFVIERSRAESTPHGFAVARNHYWIDLLLEMPAYVAVGITGGLLLAQTALTPWLLVKAGFGVVAIAANAWCWLPVLRRQRAAAMGDLAAVIRYSRMIDRVTVIGLPAALMAFALGLYLAP